MDASGSGWDESASLIASTELRSRLTSGRRHSVARREAVTARGRACAFRSDRWCPANATPAMPRRAVARTGSAVARATIRSPIPLSGALVEKRQAKFIERWLNEIAAMTVCRATRRPDSAPCRWYLRRHLGARRAHGTIATAERNAQITRRVVAARRVRHERGRSSRALRFYATECVHRASAQQRNPVL